MLGKQYIIDHVQDGLNEEEKAQGFRVYTAEILRLTCEDVASVTTGKYISAKWYDIELGKQNGREKSGDEIASEIIEHAGLSFGGEKDATSI